MWLSRVGLVLPKDMALGDTGVPGSEAWTDGRGLWVYVYPFVSVEGDEEPDYDGTTLSFAAYLGASNVRRWYASGAASPCPAYTLNTSSGTRLTMVYLPFCDGTCDVLVVEAPIDSLDGYQETIDAIVASAEPPEPSLFYWEGTPARTPLGWGWAIDW